MRAVTALCLIAGPMLLSGEPRGEGTGQGAQLAAACASCHASDGSDKGIPAIVGLEEQRIVAAMRAYKASESPSHVMHAVALSLSDEELASVARYLAEHGTSP
jgi:sulfide dehydrogenase cytochrome subunit